MHLEKLPPYILTLYFMISLLKTKRKRIAGTLNTPPTFIYVEQANKKKNIYNQIINSSAQIG